MGARSDESSKRFVSSKDWTLENLMAQNPQFRQVQRVSSLEPDRVATALMDHERLGIPVIIEHLNRNPKWPKDMFNVDWLLKKYGSEGTQSIQFAIDILRMLQ